MNKYYWIPAVGQPNLIESEDSVNKVFHDLFNDPDHHLCYIDLINSLLEDYHGSF